MTAAASAPPVLSTSLAIGSAVFVLACAALAVGRSRSRKMRLLLSTATVLWFAAAVVFGAIIVTTPEWSVRAPLLGAGLLLDWAAFLVTCVSVMSRERSRRDGS